MEEKMKFVVEWDTMKVLDFASRKLFYTCFVFNEEFERNTPVSRTFMWVTERIKSNVYHLLTTMV